MTIRFADFELDTQRFIFRRKGQDLRIRPKVFDLLAHLVLHRSRVVEREELTALLWGDTVVGPGSLSGLVNELRTVLGERGGTESSIRTVHARGYQFVGEMRGDEGVDAVGRVEARIGLDAVAPGFRPLLVDRLRDRFAAVQRGGAFAVVIEGPPGSGKSAFLDEMMPVAVHRGFDVHRLGRAEPGVGLADRLIDSLLETRGLVAVRDALPAGAVDLLEKSIFSESLEEGREAVFVAVAARHEDRTHRALATALRRLSRSAPMLIAADDVHRADAQEGRFLSGLLSLLGEARVLLLATRDTSREVRTTREGETRAVDPLRHHHRVETLRLAPLGPQGLGALFEREGLSALPDRILDELLAHLAEQEGLGADRLVRWLAALRHEMSGWEPEQRMRRARPESAVGIAREGSR